MRKASKCEEQKNHQTYKIILGFESITSHMMKGMHFTTFLITFYTLIYI